MCYDLLCLFVFAPRARTCGRRSDSKTRSTGYRRSLEASIRGMHTRCTWYVCLCLYMCIIMHRCTYNAQIVIREGISGRGGAGGSRWVAGGYTWLQVWTVWSYRRRRTLYAWLVVYYLSVCDLLIYQTKEMIYHRVPAGSLQAIPKALRGIAAGPTQHTPTSQTAGLYWLSQRFHGFLQKWQVWRSVTSLPRYTSCCCRLHATKRKLDTTFWTRCTTRDTHCNTHATCPLHATFNTMWT